MTTAQPMWIAGFRVASQTGKSIAGGVCIFGGPTLDAARRKAIANLRTRYEVPRGQVEIGNPEPYAPEA